MEKRKSVKRMSKREIAEALKEDGYELPERELPYYVNAIYHGAREGTLLWTPAHIVVTSISSPMDIRPTKGEPTP